jgi:methylated-DNA-protein-cysteine methyltransferase-like protein
MQRFCFYLSVRYLRHMPRQAFTLQVIEIIRSIPAGKVATYGGIAAMAAHPRAARQVARILHSCSEKEGLPWHRVVNRNGQIALKSEWDVAVQQERLEQEGIEFDSSGRIDLARFLWRPAD